MPVVRFINECRNVEAGRGAKLLDVAETAGINVFRGIWQGFHCGAGLGKVLPRGACGRCKVWAKADQEAGINPSGALEGAHPKIAGSYRLACKVEVLGDMEVTTKPGWAAPGQNTEWGRDPRAEGSAWMERWRKAKAGQREPEGEEPAPEES